VHGVTYGANIYPIYHTLVEQEALFKNSIASTNQRAPQKSGDLYGGGGKSNATSHTPAARHRLQLFKKARDVVVTDVLARVVKRTIKEEWRRLLVDKGFLRNLRDVLQQEAEDDEDEDERNNGGGSSSAASPYNSSFGGVGSFGKSDSNSEFVAFGAVLHSRGASFASNAKPSTDSDQPSNVAPVVSFRAFERSNGPKVSATDLTNSLNKPLADAINTILASVFTWKGRDSEEDTEGGNINNDGNSNNNRKRGGGREYPVTLKPRMFSELVFIANDAYINKMIIPTGKPGSISFKFEVELEDVRVEHMIGLIEEMLGVDLVVGTDPSSSHPPVYVDPTTNQFEAFFDLNNVDVSPILRSEALFTTIDVPLPLSAGMKSKVAEYATLQQKVAAKLVSLVDVALPVDLVHYCIDTAKHAYLHAGDVRIAHRGHINDVDFSELYQVHTQVPALHSPKSTEMLLCFEAAVAFRRSWFAALTDLPGSLRFLMKFTERTKAILSSAATAAATVVPSSVDSGGGSAGSPTTTTSRQSTASLLKGSSITLANKLKILLKAGERFSTITLSTAIEAAVLDLDGLMEAGVINGNEKKRRGVTGGMGTTPSTKGGFKELTVQHAGYLLLQPLAMLVKYHSQPTIKRNLTESLGIAVKHAGDRRDVIVQMYGEMSVEAGVACNDIAAICSTSKYDFDQAEVEFEKAVSILQQAQPEGPVIFVTINNLAFLYFRKAERLRKSATQAAANNPDEEASNSAVAKGVHVRIADLLQKAENLLNDVVQAEGRLSPLDVAAALNNLASIKLFQEKFWEAKALFDKTLAITEDEVVPDAPELPCRFYAVRNLKVLARKQYLKAVLLVQKCIRRYVERLRKRKAQKALEGITPIQWAGRAFLTRRKIARLYRFSAYYFWMKIPRLYTRKLPVASWTLPVAIREREWEKLLEEKVLLLQRVIRGSDPRRRLGPAVSFVFTHINTRRPALEMEIFRRRFMAFSQFSLLQAERCASFHYTKMATKCYAHGPQRQGYYHRVATQEVKHSFYIFDDPRWWQWISSALI
jgi:tetratricopeptide (TPR) repeat protein